MSRHNPYETVARLKKAQKLADALRRFQIGPDMVRRMSAAQWERLAVAVGVRTPTEATQAVVIEILEGK